MKPAPLPAAAPGGPLRIGSLCTGYGGLDLAVTAVLAAELAWYAEPDPHAAAILAARWPGICFGDITALDWAHVPPVDLITAGWPCQDISRHAGRRMNRPVHAPVSPAGPPTPPSGYHARVGGTVARDALQHRRRRGPDRCGQADGGCCGGHLQADGLMRAQVSAALLQVRQDAHGERGGHPDDLGPVAEAAEAPLGHQHQRAGQHRVHLHVRHWQARQPAPDPGAAPRRLRTRGPRRPAGVPR